VPSGSPARPVPTVDLDQAWQEVRDVELAGRVGEVLVERLDQAGTDVLPQQHRPGHEDVGGVIAAQPRTDLVREVLVARKDAHLEAMTRLRLELAGVPLYRRDVGVRVGREVADAAYRRPEATRPIRARQPRSLRREGERALLATPGAGTAAFA
jgi:hypothetical protein